MSADKTTISLRDSVQELRDKAREILLKLKISSSLQDLFYANKALDEAKKISEAKIKTVAIIKYDISKLDKEHPDYEYKVKGKEEDLKYAEKQTEDLEKEVERREKDVAGIEEYITEVEEGKHKVNICEVQNMVDEMIRKG